MKRELLLGAFALLISIYSSAQTQWCGTDSYNEQLLQGMSQEGSAFAEHQRDNLFDKIQSRNQKSGTIITVPVVVHVLHDNCVGNISKEQILDGLRVVNEDFRRINSDTSSTRSVFKPYAADAEIEFKLAQIDPSGKCTEGIVRINTPNTWDAQNNVKGLSYWSSSKYLNIWIVNTIASGSSGTILGYAQFPGFGNWNTFGLVVRGDQWGTIGTSNADGRTSTHEIGHCLGLYHTFQSGCGSNCSNSGDRICDTPPSFDATWGCSATQNTCSNDANGSNSPYTSNVVDQIENYMSYDRCQNMFSAMQVAVMKNVFNIYSQLGNLISASNLVATGTNPGYVPMACAPKADFCQENVSICEGNTVTFTDRSYNGPITSRSWTFQGGSPASSSDSIVTVTYNTEGIYNVTLSTGNSVGSNNKTINKVIEVLPGLADISNWRFDENFESQDAFDTLWTVDPKGGREWELTNKAAYTGNQSAFLNNYINGLDLVDNLITPSLDMTAVFAPKLYFKLAYAQKSATSSDILRLYYSYNCGNTWNIMSILAAPLMTSVSDYRTAEFFPADQSEWREFSYPISTFLSEKENLRFKFEFTSGGGNNIFLDDISLVSTTGIENYMSADNILVYPNPVKEVLYINLKNTGDEINKISVMDMSGREVKRITSFEIQTASDGLLSLDVSSMSPGVYFIQFSGKEVNPVIKKVIVQ